MNRSHLALIKSDVILPQLVSFAEKLEDHNALIDSYLDTRLTRNYSPATISANERFLKGWFAGIYVDDSTHPEGKRQLLTWEAMEPFYGRERIRAFSLALVAMSLKGRTITSYLSTLRNYFEYVLAYPYIPGSHAILISTKYGRIEQPVLQYD